MEEFNQSEFDYNQRNQQQRKSGQEQRSKGSGVTYDRVNKVEGLEKQMEPRQGSEVQQQLERQQKNQAQSQKQQNKQYKLVYVRADKSDKDNIRSEYQPNNIESTNPFLRQQQQQQQYQNMNQREDRRDGTKKDYYQSDYTNNSQNQRKQNKRQGETFKQDVDTFPSQREQQFNNFSYNSNSSNYEQKQSRGNRDQNERSENQNNNNKSSQNKYQQMNIQNNYNENIQEEQNQQYQFQQQQSQYQDQNNDLIIKQNLQIENQKQNKQQNNQRGNRNNQEIVDEDDDVQAYNQKLFRKKKLIAKNQLYVPDQDQVITLNQQERLEEQSGEKPISEQQQKEGECEEDKTEFLLENKSTLRETLIKGLKKKKIDCPICYEKIGLKGTIWSCVQCFHPFHLDCLKKWTINSNPGKKRWEIYTWSCPNCQYIYSDKLPTYNCFCNKYKNPEFDPYLIPHSCGETCGKARGVNCPHLCDIQCHPGPCPPCTLIKQEPLVCYCQKSKKDAYCSDPLTSFECNQQCQKPLNCGIHNCTRNCHQGDCKNCAVEVKSSCFCGKSQKDTFCGEKGFSCNEICNKSLDCENHKCQEICHSGPCKQCLLGPDEVSSCPCGEYSLLTLAGGNNRESCIDSIPCCGGVCKKVLPCGHSCKNSCHEGVCPPCQVKVDEPCRCKFNVRLVSCWQLTNKQKSPFLCDRICKKLKSCNFHPCNMTCCPARKGQDPEGVHLCLKVCGKPLSCGNHTCELFCHLGQCNKCPLKINEILSCVCGKTSLNPPYSCGTSPPECHKPCSRQKACLHPCHLDCHQDECPPCQYKVNKVCHCGRQVIEGVSCSKEALCVFQCTKKMSCGHKCETVCHIGDCPKDNPVAGCGRKCGKNRKFCEHKCVATCHGNSDCPNDPCKVEVVIRCRCGERSAFVECGSSDSALDRTLECNQLCKNINRFSNIHEKSKIYFPSGLVKFARSSQLQLLKIEKKAETFIKSNEKSFTIPTQNDLQKKVCLQTLLSKHYHLNVQYFYHFNQPYLVVEKTEDMVIPKMILSEYIKKVDKGEIQYDAFPFEVTLRFNISVKQDFNGENLERQILNFAREYYLEREDRFLLLHFWDKERCEEAQKKLKQSESIFNTFTVEINQKLVKDATSQSQQDLDKTRVQKKITPSQQSLQGSSQHSDEEDNQQLEKPINPEIIALRQQFFDKAQLYEFCSPEEREQRSSYMTLDIFEQDPRTAQMQPCNKWMLKSAQKEQNNGSLLINDPSKIRSPDILIEAASYLANKILDADFYQVVPFKFPRDRFGKRRQHTFNDIFTFSCDRFLGIRQDINMINEPTKQTASALEIIVRFYAISFYECQTMENNYNLKALETDFSDSISCLLNMYEKIAEKENKLEMLVYSCIFHSQDKEKSSQIISQMKDIQSQETSELVNATILVQQSIENKNFQEFFSLIRKLGYVESCIAFRFFGKMREFAINSFKAEQKVVTISQLQEILFLDSTESAINYLKSIGIDASKLNGPIEYESEEEEEEEQDEEEDDEKDDEEEESKESEEEEISKDQIKEKQASKKKEKRVGIQWRKIYEPNKQLFKEINQVFNNKKLAINFSDYESTKVTLNANVVTRAFLVQRSSIQHLITQYNNNNNKVEQQQEEQQQEEIQSEKVKEQV